MDARTREFVEQGVAASFAGTHSFGQHVGDLVARGFESYRVDYRERRSTYFLPIGDSHAVAFAAPAIAIGDSFDADAVVSAIRGAQSGEVKYPEFVERTMRAGCIGYVVWIAGRHVTYFGRRGETHVERFP